MPMPPGAYSSKEAIPEGYDKFKLNNFTPEQMELYKGQYEQTGPNSFLGQLASGQGEAYDSMEQNALRGFNDIQSGIASKFSGAGIGSRNSSGFANAQNSAASDFMKDLQAKRFEMRRSAIMDLMGISNSILGQRPYETGLVQQQQEEKSDYSGWGSAIGTGLGAAVGSMVPVVGTYVGGMAGGALGGAIGKSF